MAKVSLQGTVTVGVDLTIEQKVKLRKSLQTKAKLDQEIKALEAKKAAVVAEVAAIREETGLDTFEFEGFNVTLVAPLRKVLNYKKLVALGCKLSWLTKATEDVPSEPYVKITAPKVEK